MKSFTTAVFFAASAALTSAQIITNPTTGAITCPVPNGVYCAGTSGQTNIIVRCTDGVGQPGNCNDNLAGEFPQGVNYAPCWASSPSSGVAACSKNCIVYGGSGNYNGTFTLPGCTPTTTEVGGTTTTSTYVQSTSTSAVVYPTSSPASVTTSTYVLPTSVTTSAVVYPTSAPASVTTSTYIQSTGGSASASAPSNGTYSTHSQTTTGGPAAFTGAAVANSVGSALALAGVVAAIFV